MDFEPSGAGSPAEVREMAERLLGTRDYHVMARLYAALSSRLSVFSSANSWTFKSIFRDTVAFHLAREIREHTYHRYKSRWSTGEAGLSRGAGEESGAEADETEETEEAEVAGIKTVSEASKRVATKIRQPGPAVVVGKPTLEPARTNANPTLDESNAQPSSTVVPNLSTHKTLPAEDADPQERCNGFMRPAILILSPTKHNAWRVVSTLLHFLIPDAETADFSDAPDSQEDGTPSPQPGKEVSEKEWFVRQCDAFLACPTAVQNLETWEEGYAPPDPEVSPSGEERQDQQIQTFPVRCVDGEVRSLLPDEIMDSLQRLFASPDNSRSPKGAQGHPMSVVRQKHQKPLSYLRSFCGDLGDSFCFGIRVSPKQVKLLTDLRTSDIIVASPLGLRQRCGIDPLLPQRHPSKVRQPDGEMHTVLLNDIGILSSLHTVYLDSLELLESQNWEHLLACLWALHQTPADTLSTDQEAFCDINTLVPCFLAEKQATRCQFIAEGLYAGESALRLLHLGLANRRANPEPAQALGPEPEPLVKRAEVDTLWEGSEPSEDREVARNHGPTVPPTLAAAYSQVGIHRNSAGLLKLTGISEVYPGMEVASRSRVILHSVRPGDVVRRCTDALSTRDVPFAVKDFPKLDYFFNRVLPALVQDPEKDRGLLVVLQSYFDYARAARILKHTPSLSSAWAGLEETMTNVEGMKSRSRFTKGEVSLLMMTERYYLYRRHVLQGVRSLVFLGPPLSPDIFLELSGMLDLEAPTPTVLIVFTESDDMARMASLFPPSKVQEMCRGRGVLVL